MKKTFRILLIIIKDYLSYIFLKTKMYYMKYNSLFLFNNNDNNFIISINYFQKQKHAGFIRYLINHNLWINKMNIFLLIFLLLSISTYCTKKEDNNSTKEVKEQIKSLHLINASNDFGFNLFRKVDSLSYNTNVLVSPFSALQALSMTYNGADKDTKQAMANTLGFANFSQEEINDYNLSLTNALLSADENVRMEIANSIWYRKKYVIEKDFIDINKKYFNAEVEEANFDDPKTVDIINNWCSDKTHGKINKIIDQIPSDAIMYLINAIYFLASWQYAFDKTQTTETQFWLEDGSYKMHQQMSLQAELFYYTDDKLSIVELPYGNGKFSMVLILPNNKGKISDIIKSLNDNNWANLLSKMQVKNTIVKIPKFKLEYNSILNQPLKDMGMRIAFSDLADFTKINKDGNSSISKVYHKTYIDVYEEGTEAAAVTAVEIRLTSINEPSDIQYFVAVHPFIYAIIEKTTGVILFIGKEMDPTIKNAELK